MISIFDQIMLNIQSGYYRYIGSGSCRDVFDLGNGYVVKVARNIAGIAQNKSEYYISYYDKSGLFAKIIDTSNNFDMLIMEKADEVHHISDICKYFCVKNKKQLLKLNELQDVSKKYNLLLDDLKKKSSWGIINGTPVIIDYGFTKEVSERYYFSYS